MDVDRSRINISVAEDYIKYCLKRHNIVWDGNRPVTTSPDKYQSAMRSLGKEFEEREEKFPLSKTLKAHKCVG